MLRMNAIEVPKGSRQPAAKIMPPPSHRRILCFDVMDTIVKDPFYSVMPQFFGLTFEELMAAKHPNTWLEFERGNISEATCLERFFLDGRKVNGPGLLSKMHDSYQYLYGVQKILRSLKDSGHEMHTFSNYPVWWKMIESKLELSRYLNWTFISCEGPMKVRLRQSKIIH